MIRKGSIGRCKVVNKRLFTSTTEAIAAGRHAMACLLWASFGVVCLFGLPIGCSGENQPPQIEYIPNQTTTVSQGVRIKVQVTDDDSDSIIFELEGLPEGAKILPESPSSALVHWNPSIIDIAPGGKSYQVTVTARDEHGGVSSATFTLWVTGEGGVPVFDLPSGVVLNLAKEPSLTVHVAVKDVDSHEVVVNMLESPQGAKFEKTDGKSGYLFWQPSEAQQAVTVHRFVFSAQDETHPAITHALMVVLLNAEENAGCESTPPSVLAPPPMDVNLDNDGTLTIETKVADHESAISSVTFFWRTGEVDGPFNPLLMTESEDENGLYSAKLAPPGISPNGLLLHYYFAAIDNDDPFGTKCDLDSRLPKSGAFTIGLYPNGTPSTTCIDDNWTPDDEQNLARWVNFGSFHGKRLCKIDSDWIYFEAKANEPLSVTVTQHGQPVPLHLKLTNEAGITMAEAGNSENLLRVELTPPTTGDYYAQIKSIDANARLSFSWKVSSASSECPPEPFEPNDTPGQATPLGAAPMEGLILCPGESDYFRINAVGGKELHLILAFNHLYGDLDLELLGENGTSILAIGSGQTSTEEVIYTPKSSGTVYARVYGHDDAANSYGLALNVVDPNAVCEEDILAPNHMPEEAATVYQGVYDGMKLCPNSQDWYAIDLNGGERLDVIVEPSSALNLSVHIYTDPAQSPIVSAGLDADGWVWAKAENLPAGRVYYSVSGAVVPIDYAFLQDVIDPEGGCSPDRFEPNNDVNTATAIAKGVTTWARLCDGDTDFYSLSVPAFSNIRIYTVHTFYDGYADITLTDANGKMIGSSIDYGTGAILDTISGAEGLIYIKISGELGMTLPYDLGVFID
jgi:hypothetical protein